MPVDPRNPMPKRLRSIFSQLCHKHLGSSSRMELVNTCDGSILPPLKASRPHPTIFAGSSMGFDFFGQKWLASTFLSCFFGRCKRNHIFYQRNIKLMFAQVNNMCKRSNIFYECNIKLVFAHVNSICKSSNTKHQFFRTQWTTCASVEEYFLMVACHRTLLFPPPHPISNLSSCRCASAKERD